MKFLVLTSKLAVAAVCSLALTTGAALAQAAPAADPAATSRPETSSIGDWFVRCFPIASPSPCDIFQERQVQSTGQRILSISIAFVPSLNRHAIQISVPLDISIPKGIVLQADSYTSPTLKYRRCDRGGCYVEMAVDNALVESLAKGGAEGKVKVVADGGKEIGLTFSLKGFAAAHDDMVAKARAKAKPVEQAAAAPAATP